MKILRITYKPLKEAPPLHTAYMSNLRYSQTFTCLVLTCYSVWNKQLISGSCYKGYYMTEASGCVECPPNTCSGYGATFCDGIESCPETRLSPSGMLYVENFSQKPNKWLLMRICDNEVRNFLFDLSNQCLLHSIHLDGNTPYIMTVITTLFITIGTCCSQKFWGKLLWLSFWSDSQN